MGYWIPGTSKACLYQILWPVAAFRQALASGCLQTSFGQCLPSDKLWPVAAFRQAVASGPLAGAAALGQGLASGCKQALT